MAAFLKRYPFFASPLQCGLTLLSFYCLVQVFLPLWQWVVLDAVAFNGTLESCKSAQGACWPVLAEKYRFILFGRYPFTEHWRPAVACLVLFMGLVASTQKKCWQVRVLLPLWVGVTLIAFVLLQGGYAGLSPVSTDAWGGLPLTLVLSIYGIAGAFPLAIVLAIARNSDWPVFRVLATCYIELVRGIPLISVLFMAAILLPLFLGDNAGNVLVRAQIGFTLFTAAYLAEAIRGGLQALPTGQHDGVRALGLSPWQGLRYVLLPQALRNSLPAIVNIFIGAFKDSSLVAIIGLMDVLLATKTALADPAWQAYYVEAYVFTAVLYFCCCFALSRYSLRLEKTS